MHGDRLDVGALVDAISRCDVEFSGQRYRGFQFFYEHDFDRNGVFYWLGTSGKTQPYRNPHSAGFVWCIMSSIHLGHAFNVVERTSAHRPNYTKNQPYSTIEIDFGSRRLFLPNKYTIRHGSSSPGHALRNWELQAKVGRATDGSEDTGSGGMADCWITLSSHENDTSLSDAPNASCSWDVAVPPELREEFFTIGFRHFRILQTGPNSSANDCLFCCGVELYGILFEKVVELKASSV